MRALVAQASELVLIGTHTNDSKDINRDTPSPMEAPIGVVAIKEDRTCKNKNNQEPCSSKVKPIGDIVGLAQLLNLFFEGWILQSLVESLLCQCKVAHILRLLRGCVPYL